MLKLYNVKKDYKMTDTTVHALKGISLNFRKSEFVSVLGPSGCGKTTMLNIIGGLDRYTDGDLIIEGKSTKEYRSRDWDRYRNQTVGFIFQSYNLIPHLNVLQNVELALTISGVSHRRKKAMATDALIKVGLGEQLKKRPSQMSGGQMQRVAIARAIVNNPEIILADEPTGALDSVTSEQIMDLLQEISDDRLVIMVTHNPELAARYSTRIVKLKDGEIVSDSNPYDGLPTILAPVKPIENTEELARDAVAILSKQEQRKAARQSKRKARKEGAVDNENALPVESSVSAQDSPALSDAASAYVAENTDGEEKYVASITPEEPEQVSKITKQPKEKKVRSSMSLFTAMSLSARNLWTKKARTGLTAFAGSIGIIGIALVLSLSNGFGLYMDDLERSTLSIMPVTVSSVGIKVNVNEAMAMQSEEGAFPDYDYILPYEPSESISGVKVSANIITDEYVDYVKAMDKSLLSSVQYKHTMVMRLLTKDYSGKVKSVTKNSSIGWQELLWDNFMKQQYDVLAGGYPGSAEGNAVLQTADPNFATYDESGKKARQAVLVVSQYNSIKTDILSALGYDVDGNFDPETNKYQPMYFSEFLGKQLKVEDNDDYYAKHDYDKYYGVRGKYAEAWESDKSIPVTIVGIMRVKENVLYPFLSQGIAYTEALTELVLANAKSSQIVIDQLKEENADVNLLTYGSFSSDLSTIVTLFSSYGITESQVVTLMQSTLESIYTGEENKSLRDDIKACTRVNDITATLTAHGKSVGAIKVAIAAMIELQLGIDSGVVLDLLNSAYQTQLAKIGASDRPTEIYIYPASFEAKDEVLAYLDAWNKDKSATETVTYTDLASTVSEVISKVVDLVSYVLIAFAAISLIVSSIMISIITYISVLERTVEIGVLRSIGARKRDIANVFNAETAIIGTVSGVLGVVLAWLIDFPLNYWISTLVQQAPKQLAQMNPIHGVILVALSIVLNILSGLIPAILASKKDPVIALRSGG